MTISITTKVTKRTDEASQRKKKEDQKIKKKKIERLSKILNEASQREIER